MKHALAVVVLLGCGGGEFTETQQKWLDLICACSTEECVAEYTGALAQAVHAQESKITSAQAAAVTKKVFACVKEMRAKSGGAEGTAGGEEATVTAPDPAPPVPAQVDPEELAEKKRKAELAKEVATLSALTDLDEIMAAFRREAKTVCACKAIECMHGYMPKLSALGTATRRQDKAAMKPHGREMGELMEKGMACVQVVQAAEVKKQMKVSDVGEQVIKAAAKWADAVCACGDLKCVNEVAELGNFDRFKTKTAADSMNERFIAEMGRAGTCQGKLMGMVK